MPRNDDMEWMPFFANDWLTDGRVRQLTPEARGVYFDLLCHQWIEEGIPVVSENVRRLAGQDVEDWALVWKSVRQFFPRVDTRTRMNPRLNEVYQVQKQLLITRKAKARKGGLAKAQRRKKFTPDTGSAPSRENSKVKSKSDEQLPVQKPLSVAADPAPSSGSRAKARRRKKLTSENRPAPSRLKQTPSTACDVLASADTDIELSTSAGKQDSLPNVKSKPVSKVVGESALAHSPNPFGFIAYWKDATEQRGFTVRLEPPVKFGDFMVREARELGLKEDRRQLARIAQRGIKKFTAHYSKRTRGKTRGSAIGPKMLTEELVAWIQKDLATLAGRTQSSTGKGKAGRIDDAVRRRLEGAD